MLERKTPGNQRLHPTRKSCLFFQLYVNPSRELARALIRQVRAMGFKGLFITVDTPFVGKRTEDCRLRARADLMSGANLTSSGPPTEDNPGIEQIQMQAATTLSRSLNWSDLSWIRKEWDGPIVIKGIHCVEDARKAVEMDVQGIYLSNHGGRQLHSVQFTEHLDGDSHVCC